MTELGPESKALIDEERALGEPAHEELEARRLAVFAAIGLPIPAPGGEGGPGGDAGAAPSSSTTPVPATVAAGAAKAGLGGSAKLAIALGLVTASTLGVLALRPDSPAATVALPASPAAPPTTVELAVSPAPELPPAPEVAPPDEPRRASRPAPAASELPAVVPIENHEPPPESPADDSLSEESMVLAAAEAQLRAGHAGEALSLYDRALARHPSGALRAEALSGRIAALCRLGRVDEGRRELERFLGAYPRSPSGPRLRSVCGEPR